MFHLILMTLTMNYFVTIYLTDLVNNNAKPIIILGDFNFPNIDWTTLIALHQDLTNFVT